MKKTRQLNPSLSANKFLNKKLNLLGITRYTNKKYYHWSDLFYEENATKCFGASWPSIRYQLYTGIINKEMTLDAFWKEVEALLTKTNHEQ